MNHALYCAHLAPKGGCCPTTTSSILDEAHAFAENATNAFAGEIAADALTRLAGMFCAPGSTRRWSMRSPMPARRWRDHRRPRGRVDVPGDAELGSALVSAAERLAAANAKLDKSDDYAKRTSQLATGRLEVLRRLAAPEDDDVVWVDTIGRSRRLRIAPVEPGDVIGAPARPAAGHRGVGNARRRAAVPVGRVRNSASNRNPARHVGRENDDEGRLQSNAGRGYVRSRRRRRSTGRSRASSTSGRTCPIRGARAPTGSRSRAIACAGS